MPDSIKSYLPTFIFTLTLLLFLFLGETYLNYFLLMIVGIIGLVFLNKLKFKKISSFYFILILWIMFLIGLVVSSVFSRNIPLTIMTSFQYVAGFVIFLLLLLIDKKLFSMKLFLSGFLLVGLSLILISLLFYTQPQLGGLLPPMNLIYASYGHNHLAALILMILPISWSWAINKSKKANLYYFIPMGISIALIMSFGRVAISIGLLQFAFILLLSKKINIKIPNYVKIFVGGLFLSTITAFLVLTLFYESCPFSKFEKQLCKPISSESRPSYWFKALKIFKEDPITGSGPGTYGLSAKKYELNPFNFSRYAHNEALQVLAEMGVIGGGAFILLMGGLITKASSSTALLKKFNYEEAIFLSLLSIYINGFLDFDWIFSGIFFSIIFLLVLLIKSRQHELQPTNKIFKNFIIIVYFFSCLSLIIIGSTYAYTEYLIRSEKIGKAFDFFPYFHWHKKIFHDYREMTIKQENIFWKIYQNDPYFYIYYLSLNEEDFSVENQDLKEKLWEVSPIDSSQSDPVTFFINNEKWGEAQEWIDKILITWEQALAAGNTKITYSDQVEFSEKMLLLADNLYLRGDYESAAYYYEKSRWANPFILGRHQPIFLETEENINPEENILFFRNLSGVESRYFGGYLENYFSSYLKVAQEMISIGKIDDIEKIAEEIFSWQEKKDNLVWNKLAIPLIFPEKYLLVHDKSILGKKAFFIWELLNDQDVFIPSDTKIELILMLIKSGNIDEAQSMINSISNWDNQLTKSKLEIIRSLQNQANNFIENDHSTSFQLLKLMQIVEPDDYWIMMQSANLAILKKDYLLASEYYQSCIKNVDYQHDDCLGGLSDLELNLSDENRYWEVSQIILGEAIWQDFVD